MRCKNYTMLPGLHTFFSPGNMLLLRFFFISIVHFVLIATSKFWDTQAATLCRKFYTRTWHINPNLPANSESTSWCPLKVYVFCPCLPCQTDPVKAKSTYPPCNTLANLTHQPKLTCKLFDILTWVLLSTCGPRILPVPPLPTWPSEKPKSSWYASSSISAKLILLAAFLMSVIPSLAFIFLTLKFNWKFFFFFFEISCSRLNMPIFGHLRNIRLSLSQ